ncbi:leucine-rich repeat-containing protein 15-like [Hydractinia symbiolongicarpus]|uniref:leucine-rich repeat-containing protein 15-like n=1 Tax=Hydractinia symbiolongicarpus TaxID=13093 RepID=UPI0025502558|nr:leucine-rich repeat-containing protein 15-like [Hydractinia symbiolongicarpus]
MLTLHILSFVVAQLLSNQVQSCPLACFCYGRRVHCGKKVSLTKSDLERIGQTISRNITTFVLENYNEDTIILKSFPVLPTVKEFIIENSNLSEIPKNLYTKMPLLTFFGSRNNKINILKKEQFLGFSKLVNITIQGELKIIEGGAFSQLPNLKKLELSKNKLTVLTSRSFSNLENLEFLYLRQNHISTIQDSAFFNLKKLTVLNLFGNKIKHISTRTFDGSTKLQHLQLAGNPLKRRQEYKIIRALPFSRKGVCCTKEYVGEKCQTKIGTMSINGKSKVIIPLVGSFLALLQRIFGNTERLRKQNDDSCFSVYFAKLL